jgi:hypothetical protein
MIQIKFMSQIYAKVVNDGVFIRLSSYQKSFILLTQYSSKIAFIWELSEVFKWA